MARRIETANWGSTPLGDASTWSDALRTAIAICLSAQQPTQLWWGPDLTVIYNDACIPVLGARHPTALGRPARVVWADAWDRIAPSLAGGRADVDGMSFTRLPHGWLVRTDDAAFLAALNHALRNPLSPLVTTIGVLRHQGVPEAEALERQVHELVKVVDSLGFHPPSPPPMPASISRGTRLLLVEDNNEEAHTLRDALVGLGFEVALAHDGPLALSLARTFAPHLALIDLGLPVMDGYELARRLRRTAECPIIAVTARALDSDRRKSADEGFRAHLVKPIDVARLVEVIASAQEPA
jgi:CheY-like chemotaxis protein